MNGKHHCQDETEEIHLALARGFTRSDLLLMGELTDVSAQATRLGFLAPVAVSATVAGVADALARLHGRTPAAAIEQILGDLVGIAAYREFHSGQQEPFSSRAFPNELQVSAGQDEHGTWVLTIYSTDEEPAPV